jgi:hypothetical protein
LDALRVGKDFFVFGHVRAVGRVAEIDQPGTIMAATLGDHFSYG